MKKIQSIFFLFILTCTLFSHEFNQNYENEFLNRVAFPIGGMGAGMVCLEGNGALSHVSVRNEPNIFFEPFTFAAISVKGLENGAKVLQGPVQAWKIFGAPNTGNGASGSPYGLPRFEKVSFLARFPFGIVKLSDSDIPLDVTITGWSPFIPSDADNSSLPVGALEYSFSNTSNKTIDAVFSFNSRNFMKIPIASEWGGSFEKGDAIHAYSNGFILHQDGLEENPHYLGDFVFFVENNSAVVDYCWFRGGWFDSVTMTWKTIEQGETRETPPENSSPGGSIYVPFKLNNGEEKTIRLLFAWYVPKSNISVGSRLPVEKECKDPAKCCPTTYVPWYANRFNDIKAVAKYWKMNYDNLRQNSELFCKSFYASTLPAEVLEAVAANLTILKSPTVMRQHDGRLWAWEGCHDASGCCYGSCTHVWNYAQAIPHLFPSLERTLRETEFTISQDDRGHQTFRDNLPISPPEHNFHAAVDGQLGGIMKIYREWRISGDTDWLRELWPKVKLSMLYCINTWDPKHKGVVEEPHHNTYDIEFWGPDGMCTSFYLGALYAMIRMGEEFDEDISDYQTLLDKGRTLMEKDLYNGEYFFQKVTTEGLEAKDPLDLAKNSWTVEYSEEALELLKNEGPKYQYGNGCISDGVLGFWMAQMCGLGEIGDFKKVQSHLLSVYKYNLKHDLFDHVNPQRPSYAAGTEGGLLLCTWPHGDQPSLPFVYSNEVWTGIEYQVASHLILQGFLKEGLDVVATCRRRYDGRIRNPFNEYECGHWYARALSSYGLLQVLTGVRYDAVDKTLYINSQIGDNFTSFLSTETGFANVGLVDGKAVVDVKYGDIDIENIIIKDNKDH